MRASWTDVNGRKFVITDIQEIREIRSDDKIEFKSIFDVKVFIDDIMALEGHRVYESCRFIDSEIILSADKE